MIYVRTKPGRAAFYEGKVIPQDKFVPVTDDPYIRRLIHHWEDLEVEGGEHDQREDQKKMPQGTRGPTPTAAAEPTQPVTKN
jgi:hypothetical protein